MLPLWLDKALANPTGSRRPSLPATLDEEQ